MGRNMLEALINISTHAPLAGRDMLDMGDTVEDIAISTHAPLAGRDHYKGL